MSDPRKAPCFDDDRVGEALAEFILNGAAPGIGLVVEIAGSRTTCFSGLADVESRTPLSHASRFQISCLMKVIVSRVIQHLAATSQLAVSDFIASLLPEMGGVPALEGVTVGHLMCHTAGYPGPNILIPSVRLGYSIDKFHQHLKSVRSIHSPGSVFDYDHSEHVLLAEIAQRLTGKDIAQLAGEIVLSPLGITSGSSMMDRALRDLCVTGYADSRKVSGPPACAFWRGSVPDHTISLQDLVTLGGALLADWRDEAEASPDKSRSATLPPIVRFGLSERYPLTFGPKLAYYGTGIYGHNGSTSGSTIALRIIPSHGAIVAVGMNSWSPSARDTIIDWICEGIIGSHLPSSLRMNAEIGSEILGGMPLAALDGRYVGSCGRLVIKAATDRLDIYGQDERLWFSLLRTTTGTLRLEFSDTAKLKQGLAFCFFRAVDDGMPCISTGMFTFKRIHER